ncbi:SET methyltransferase domain containing protein [Nitzschia inconspicua]|uniref:SET methyltransferase domain containing protein n=1 Tax=Nitzschia inconspicua TaxID=303405 RepID=A0A9K3Q8G6_9STRA|nr:SET methyltransferase domain containing protein [Nitzschia inconspicua]
MSHNTNCKERHKDLLDVHGTASKFGVQQQLVPVVQQTNRPPAGTEQIWQNLVNWVHQAGGFVHPALRLTGHGPSRGVVTIAPIQKGDLLIRIPPSCVISGIHVPSKVDGTPASPWLRCLGALLQAKKESQLQSTSNCRRVLPSTTLISCTPYIESLPSRNEYETLFQWSLSDIQTFLGGTTLGKLLLLDRNEKTLENRYRLGVVPFLEHLGVLTKKKPGKRKRPINGEEVVGEIDNLTVDSSNYQSFLEASMCISTRGFHLMNEDDDQQNETNAHGESQLLQPYNGPFLLPVIDLLNHDPDKSCTTLQRDAASGDFTMIAERSLNVGEDVVHSYGNELTSAQLLQTFGFVPLAHSKKQLLVTSQAQGWLTPLTLHKIDHLIRSCLIVKNSAYPEHIQNLLNERRDSLRGGCDESNDDDYWDVESIPDRRMTESMPEEFLISINSKDMTNQNFLLSEDLITLLAVQFLPEDAFTDIFQSENTMIRLDRSILEEDPYLGLLVCYALMTALSIRMKEYASPTASTSTHHDHGRKVDQNGSAKAILKVVKRTIQDDTNRLSELISKYPRELSEDREMFGRTVRIEELTNLLALAEEVAALFDKLNQ